MDTDLICAVDMFPDTFTKTSFPLNIAAFLSATYEYKIVPLRIDL